MGVVEVPGRIREEVEPVGRSESCPVVDRLVVTAAVDIACDAGAAEVVDDSDGDDEDDDDIGHPEVAEPVSCEVAAEEEEEAADDGSSCQSPVVRFDDRFDVDSP